MGRGGPPLHTDFAIVVGAEGEVQLYTADQLDPET